MLTRRTFLHGMMTGIRRHPGGCAAGVGQRLARYGFHAQFWCGEQIENEADRIARYKSFVAYMENALRVPLKMHQASDYAGTIEALKARKLEFARFGPASYAQAWLVTERGGEPLVVEMDSEGLTGLSFGDCRQGR